LAITTTGAVSGFIKARERQRDGGRIKKQKTKRSRGKKNRENKQNKKHKGEKERKTKEQRRDKDWPCHCLHPCRKKNDLEIIYHEKSVSASSS
jgi:hypothetical protein